MLLMCLGFPLHLGAQKIQDKSFWIKYVSLPAFSLPEDYLTFSVTASGSILGEAGLTSAVYTSKVTMDGFKRLNGEQQGHLRLQMDAGDALNDSPELKTKTVKTKDKEGKEVNTTYHFYTFSFRNISGYQILNHKGEVFYSGSIPFDKTYDSQNYSSQANLKKEVNRLFGDFKRKYAEEATNNLRATAENILRGRYDYQFTRDRYELYLIKGHRTEEEFASHFEKVKQVFEAADHTTSSADLLEKLNESIIFYEAQANKNPRDDKKLKRIYKAANYNLAVIYTFTDKLDLAKQYSENVIKSEGKDAKSRRLLDFIEAQELKMKAIGINTLHYKRNLERAVTPGEEISFQEVKKEVTNSTITTDSKVFMGTDTISGIISLEMGAEDFIFGTGGNVKFFVSDKAELKEIDLTSNHVDGFLVSGRYFQKNVFSPSAKGSKSPEIQILEKIYTSEKINFYKYYPSTGILSGEKSEFALKRRSDDLPVSLEDTSFLLWNKGLSKYFSDCEELVALCESGEIKKNKDDLLKAVRIYAEICE